MPCQGDGVAPANLEVTSVVDALGSNKKHVPEYSDGFGVQSLDGPWGKFAHTSVRTSAEFVRLSNHWTLRVREPTIMPSP
jgi:hypothetical protein